MKKRVAAIAVFLALLILAAAVVFEYYSLPGERAAKKRVIAFAELVNYRFDEPEKVYEFMTEKYRSSISRDDFITAFVKERSYPYLTPFFINFLSISMAEDNRSGVAVLSQAARLPGMLYELPFVYENGNYYMIMNEYAGFPDGSYLEKFDSIPKYLTEGWD